MSEPEVCLRSRKGGGGESVTDGILEAGCPGRARSLDFIVRWEATRGR